MNTIAKITPLLRLPSAVDCFDYSIPPDLLDRVKNGSLVKIPWRGGYGEGAVLQIQKTANAQTYRTRPITSLLLGYPVLTAEQLRFLKKFSDYYFVTWGYAARMALPSIPKRASIKERRDYFGQGLNFPIGKTQIIKLENFFARWGAGLPGQILAQDISSAIWFIQKIVRTQATPVFLFLPTKGWVNIFSRVFKKNFAGKLAVYHAGLPKNEAWQNYLKILKRQVKLIITTRLGIFLPKQQNDISIFFDAAAEEFKQVAQHPRYDSRILTEGRTILLSSAEELSPAGKYSILPGASARRTNLQIIDLTSKLNRSEEIHWLSEKVLRETRYNMDAGQKTVFICLRDKAKNEALLSVDKIYSALTKIIKNGIITKADKLSPGLPNFDILITTPTPLERLDLTFWRGKIGTLAICSIEPLLALPDYRKSERAYYRVSHWLMLAQELRVADVYLQTWHPDNAVIAALKKNSPADLWQEELGNRKKFDYPPFAQLIKIVYKGNDKNELPRVKNKLNEFSESGLLVRGPYPSRARGKKELPTLLLKLKNRKLKLPLGSLGPDWLIDRDPENVL